MFKQEISEEEFRKLAKGFCEGYLGSVVGGVMNLRIYCQVGGDKWGKVGEGLGVLA